MIEWLALILLVPAILVPIVLLFGFAGCGFEAEASPPPPPPPPPPPMPEKAFEATLTEDGQSANRCIVQRIEPVRLFKSGNLVRITLQRPSAGNLIIKNISISRAADTPGSDPYDSAGGLNFVPETYPLMLPQDPGNAAFELNPVSFALDQTKPLLLASDIEEPGNVPRSPVQPGAGARAFVGPLRTPPLHEAAIADRRPSVYASVERTILVQRIDVSE